jgi:hypothetical protein
LSRYALQAIGEQLGLAPEGPFDLLNSFVIGAPTEYRTRF